VRRVAAQRLDGIGFGAAGLSDTDRCVGREHHLVEPDLAVDAVAIDTALYALSHALRMWRLSWPGTRRIMFVFWSASWPSTRPRDDAVRLTRRVHPDEVLECVPALANEHSEVSAHSTI
jgi:hypothetical protein